MEAAASERPRPTVAVYQRRGYVTGGDTLTGELLSIAGFANDGGRLAGTTGGFVSLEKLVAAHPDFIVVSTPDARAVDQGTALLSHPALATALPAVAAHRAAAAADGVRRPVAARRPRPGRPRSAARRAKSLISLDHLWLLAIALALDAAFGDPEPIWRRLPHPVAILGGLIDRLDRRSTATR